MPFGPSTLFWKPDLSSQVMHNESLLQNEIKREADPEKKIKLKSWADKALREELENQKYLRPLSSEFEKNVNQLSKLEMIWVQWYMLEVAPPEALLCASNLHAGPGQLTFGRNWREKADLTVVLKPGKIRFLNFHGGYYHYRGHTPDCALASVRDPDMIGLSKEVFLKEFQKSTNLL